MRVKVAQLCLTLCGTMNHTVHGVLQVRILGWVAFPFPRGSSQPREQTQVCRQTLYQLSHRGSAGQRRSRWLLRKWTRAGLAHPLPREHLLSPPPTNKLCLPFSRSLAPHLSCLLLSSGFGGLSTVGKEKPRCGCRPSGEPGEGSAPPQRNEIIFPTEWNQSWPCH